MKETIIIFAIFFPFGYFLTLILFDILLRGFSPLLPSRPWVVEQIMAKLEIPKKKKIKMIAFSSGRSGFFHALRKKYPDAEMIGVESSFFAYLVAKIQAFLRRTNIKIIRQPYHRVYVRDVDFIYSHLKPDEMRNVGRKFKFECPTDTVIVSTGFNYSSLNSFMVIELPDKKGRLAWLSKNQKMFSRKSSRFKKEKKAFFYRI